MPVYFIVDYRLPDIATDILSQYGTVLHFPGGIVEYDAIRGHPDVYLSRSDKNILAAFNTPDGFLTLLDQYEIPYSKLPLRVGEAYPETAVMNIWMTEKLILCGFPNIAFWQNIFPEKKIIPLKQAYVRCTTFVLDGRWFSSDKGIIKQLQQNGEAVSYVCPDNIQLNPFPNGFAGGCIGSSRKKIFFSGDIACAPAFDEFHFYATSLGYEWINLLPGCRAMDIGGILSISI